MNRHYDIRVFGRVQGVGFRYATRSRARELNLKGWVENHKDGSVMIEVQGDERMCAEFIQWCRHGPGYSWVERIEIREKEPETMEKFNIRH
ncbi:MAG TPA: acylphosphatase [Thermoplasmataceae archaeon]|nr:acylphosphatase [Thermoplasmataceae archaeon]